MYYYQIDKRWKNRHWWWKYSGHNLSGEYPVSILLIPRLFLASRLGVQPILAKGYKREFSRSFWETLFLGKKRCMGRNALLPHTGVVMWCLEFWRCFVTMKDEIENDTNTLKIPNEQDGKNLVFGDITEVADLALECPNFQTSCYVIYSIPYVFISLIGTPILCNWRNPDKMNQTCICFESKI